MVNDPQPNTVNARLPRIRTRAAVPPGPTDISRNAIAWRIPHHKIQNRRPFPAGGSGIERKALGLATRVTRAAGAASPHRLQDRWLSARVNSSVFGKVQNAAAPIATP